MPNKKKTLYGILLLAVIALNLFLTLQPTEDTVKLSESFRLWLEQFGYHTDFHTFRSNAHLIVFFVIGAALTLFGLANRWKWWQILVAGLIIGFLDEGLKFFLPTREFGLIDLLKDCIGVFTAFCVFAGIYRLCGNKGGNNGTKA